MIPTSKSAITGHPMPTVDVETPWSRFASDFCESRIAMAALFSFMCVVVLAVLSPLISMQNPYDLAQIDIMDGTLPPLSVDMEGSTYWLGTDEQGRDMLSAILYGLRISLTVGAMSGVFAFVMGVTVGITAANLGGRLDAVIMRIVDIQLGFPAILIALILLAVLGRGVDKVIIALVASQWVYYARVARGAALVELRKEHVEAARCLALRPYRILIRHVLPNCMPPLLVVGTVEVAHAIALEATLSFLGVGLPVTEPSLGLLIANGYAFMISGRYWISFFPGVALLITIASINLVGDQLRDVLNPRLQR
jgi:peptide/nickel transport system permease protein